MLGEIGVEIIAGIAIFIFGSLVTIVAIRWRWLRRVLGKIGIHIKVPRPQLDLDLEYVSKKDTTRVLIKNAGDQAAFNVYSFLFELFHASESGEYKISSLGSEGIKAGVLAPSESVLFGGKHIKFDGCNVTYEQEIWIEYTDETGLHYRTRIIPPTPRGDDLKVEHPVNIKERLPHLSGLSYTGNRDLNAIRRGRKGLDGLHYV